MAALLLSIPVVAGAQAPREPGSPRPRVGVAFGGGSARGLAHVGVVRWLEEHRIPIDLIAGTSMGGLIGGAFSSGMSSEDLTELLEKTDWDEMFGFSPFRFKNIRRKDDARDYPSRLELGLKHGLSLPQALNNGQQVDLLLARIGGPYLALRSFDELPTPFRAVAVDLVTGEQVVLDSGMLSSAMRATMSLPGVFPPVKAGGRVLVDGGAMNNVPADVVRAMGADVVIAINVGKMGETRDVSSSIFGILGQTVDVMMQTGTRASLKHADIIINPPLEGFASLDFRRSAELAAEGYRAAEAMKDRLLPLAVSEAEWAAYRAQRQARRRATLPTPEFVTVVGAVASDQGRIEEVLAARVGRALDVDALEIDLEALTGLDRYETVGWQLETVDGRPGLRVEAQPKAHAPPFLMFGVSLQNTTRDDFAFQLAARYLAFDVAGSGSELRVDGAMGAQPRFGAALYRPIRSPFFVAVAGDARQRTVNFLDGDVVVARYSETRALLGFDVGLNLGRDGDLRLGMSYGQLDTSVESGDPALPELHGAEARTRLAWRHDRQDSQVVPSRGLRVTAAVEYISDSPQLPEDFPTGRSNEGVTRAEGRASMFWPLRSRDRLFAFGGAGTTSGHPLATEQFELGAPLRLGAFNGGELRGENYVVATVGYLKGMWRLPDFLGGTVFVGGWLENGAAFNEVDAADLRTNLSVGTIADTLIGPMLLGASFDVNGAWRYYVGVGRLF